MKSKYLGLKLRMNNGMYAKCIAFRRAGDIDVQFEDGTIVKHKSSSSFKNGKIANPSLGKQYASRRSIVGMTLRMNNGMNATCIAYRGALDIDIQFEDGTIVTNKQKIHFLKGAILNPNWTTQSLPQRVIFECILKYFKDAKYNYRPSFMISSLTGAKMEIDIWIPECGVGIEYDGYPWHKEETKSSKEKARLFEEQDAVKTIYTFLEKGCIEHKGKKHRNIQLDCTSSSSSDNSQTFIPYLKDYIVAILQDLGIKNPKVVLDKETIDAIRKKSSNSLIGQTIKMNNGMNATCIAYKRSDNIDVQFEDGTIIEHVNKQSFLRGQVTNPVLGRGKSLEKDYVGMTSIMNNGMLATIIRSNGYDDIDVQFEDGTVVRNISKARFERKNIANPTIGKNVLNHRKASVERKTLLMSCGLKATCTKDGGASDLTIQFEDGVVVTKVARSNFLKGSVAHPKFGKMIKKKNRASILGMTRKMNNGLKATCIVYRSYQDIDVQFEDGSVIQHKTKNSFFNGCIRHPKESKQLTKINNSSCIGVTIKMKNGLNATCIAYRGSGDIDVQFEDGAIARHKDKSKFLKGNIGYPRNKQ